MARLLGPMARGRFRWKGGDVKVYVVVSSNRHEGSYGGTFSSREKAERWLDEEIGPEYRYLWEIEEDVMDLPQWLEELKSTRPA
jgi:hypothetical protein